MAAERVVAGQSHEWESGWGMIRDHQAVLLRAKRCSALLLVLGSDRKEGGTSSIQAVHPVPLHLHLDPSQAVSLVVHHLIHCCVHHRRYSRSNPDSLPADPVDLLSPEVGSSSLSLFLQASSAPRILSR